MDTLEITFREHSRGNRIVCLDCEIVRLTGNNEKWRYTRKGYASVLRQLRTMCGRRIAYNMAIRHRIVNPHSKFIQTKVHDVNAQANQVANDITRKANDYVKYAQSHGNTATNDSTRTTLIVTIAVHWTHIDSGTQGRDDIQCRTFNEVRAALGY